MTMKDHKIFLVFLLGNFYFPFLSPCFVYLPPSLLECVGRRCTSRQTWATQYGADGWSERWRDLEIFVGERQIKLLQGQSHLVCFDHPGSCVCVCVRACVHVCCMMPLVTQLLCNRSSRHVNAAVVTVFCGWLLVSCTTFDCDSAVRTFSGV